MDQILKCIVCDEKETSKEELIKHIDKNHLAAKECHKCAQCNHESKDSTALEVHMKKAHSKDTSYVTCQNGSKINANVESVNAPHVDKVRECQNQETCVFKSQRRYYYYHKVFNVLGQVCQDIKLDPTVVTLTNIM